MEEVPQNVMLWVTGMAGALFDYYHRRSFRAIRLTIILVLEENTLNRDGEMITEIRRASIKEGMK